MAGKPRLTLDEFIRRAKAVHGDLYDYSLVEYKNMKTKVKIICPTCGVFEQIPEKHLAGQGCPKCVQKRIEQTNLKRYGVRRPLQSQQVKTGMQKRMVRKYGVNHVSKISEMQEK